MVKNLDKSEKRHFKLYAKRINSSKDGLFVKLFEILDKANKLNDSKFQKLLDVKSQNQYANIKRHLYAQIVKSLRLLYISKEDGIMIREQLDYATILYGKGLYQQCLTLLERSKIQALKANETIMLLQIIELQKKIESRHITRSRSVKNRIENLVEDSQQIRQTISKTSALSDLSLNIQGLYIKHGFAKNERDEALFISYFDSNKPLYEESSSFYESVLCTKAMFGFIICVLNLIKAWFIQ